MDDLFGLLTKTGSDPVPLTGVRVTGDILGRGARVKVAQRFRNDEAQAIEAVYRFPLPETAAVCGFSATAGGRRITGSVEEREKAFETYDDALARGDGAFLLDQERPNIFTLSVGSLPAGAEAVVEIEYVALLDQRGKDDPLLAADHHLAPLPARGHARRGRHPRPRAHPPRVRGVGAVRPLGRDRGARPVRRRVRRVAEPPHQRLDGQRGNDRRGGHRRALRFRDASPWTATSC